MEHVAIIIEDDPVTSKIIGQIINQPVRQFESASDFNRRAEGLSPSCVFVDIHLNMNESGLDLIPSIRRRWPQVPILVITGDKAQDAVQRALEAGANDFLMKPLNAYEVKARLHARLFECALSSKKEQMSFQDITLDFRYNTISCGSKQSFLSLKEINLLKLLIDSKGAVVPRQTIMREIWGKLRVTDNCIDRKIFEVRHALEEVGSKMHIQSVYGKGVFLNAISPSQSASQAPGGIFTEYDFSKLTHVDASLLQKICQLDEGGENHFVDDIITTFMASSRQSLEALRLGVTTENANAVEKNAHRLKSAARELGSKRVSELCESLETAAKAKSHYLFAPLFHQLQNELGLVWDELDLFQSSHKKVNNQQFA